jgi:hypothetical protein
VCAVQGTYPDGTAFNLGSVEAIWVGGSGGSPAAYAAHFALPVAANAMLGNGTLAGQCSYLGVERLNSPFEFRVIAP